MFVVDTNKYDQSDWYFILATRLKLRSIYRTVTFRQVQLKNYFELQYFILINIYLYNNYSLYLLQFLTDSVLHACYLLYVPLPFEILLCFDLKPHKL
jgi:hypothetical protein